MDGSGRGRRRGSAIEKALLLLDAICEQPQPIGLPDLAARLNLPRQTVHRVLRQLEDTGLVIRDPGRDRFAVGPRLSRLALSAIGSSNQGAAVRAILQELVDEVQETCNVGTLRGMDFVYLERIECHWPLRIHLHAGSSFPANSSAGGKAMLAFLPPAVRARLLHSRRLVASTENSVTDVDKLESILEEVREKGYALNIEELAIGIIGVGVPVLDKSGRVLAALAMHGPLARISRELAEAEVPRLRRAAERLAELWSAQDDGSAD